MKSNEIEVLRLEKIMHVLNLVDRQIFSPHP
jgi:hypothetical protein